MQIPILVLLSLLSIAQSPFQNKKVQLDTVSDSLKVHLLADLCFEYLPISLDSAKIFGKKSIALSKSIGYAGGLAQGSNDIGYVYYYRSEYDSALFYWIQALEIRKLKRDTLAIGSSLNKLGAIYFQLAQFEESMEIYLEAGRLYEAKNDSIQLSKIYNNIAGIHFEQDQYEKALLYYKKSMAIKEKHSDHYEIAGTLLNIANIYYKKEKFDSAILTSKKVATILQKNNLLETQYAGISANNLAEYLLQTKKYDEALSYANQALSIRKKLDDQQGILSSQIAIATINIYLGNFQEAEKGLFKALASSKEKGLKLDESKVYADLVRLYKEKRDFEKAFEYNEKYHAFNDSIKSQDSRAKINELQTQYETEKKEQTIEVQTAQLDSQAAQLRVTRLLTIGLILLLVLIIIIALQQRKYMLNKRDKLLAEEKAKIKESQIEAAINTQEEERKRFARDLHDGFGQMISVLNLNLSNLDSHPEKRQEVYQNSTEVLDQMYKELKSICFNLMPETLIKNGLTDAIDEFALRINNADKIQIETNFFGLEKRLTDIQEISLYRITQEWVNNVVKYSDAKNLTIQLTKDEEELNLLIEDDGMGFDKTMLTQGSGNGWKNLNSRANLIKGVLELDTNQETRGTTLIINIPVVLPTDVQASKKVGFVVDQ